MTMTTITAAAMTIIIMNKIETKNKLLFELNVITLYVFHSGGMWIVSRKERVVAPSSKSSIANYNRTLFGIE